MIKNYTKLLFIALTFVSSETVFAQNIAINIAGNHGSPSAILDLSDASNANLGFLMPSVNLATTTLSPVAGIIVYNNNASYSFGKGFYYWSGSAWLYLTNSGTSTLATLSQGTGITAFTYNGSAAATVGLANTGVTAANYGSATTVPTFTVNAQGQLTSAANVAITGISTLNGGTIGSVLSNSAANTPAWNSSPSASGQILLSNSAGVPSWLTTGANGILYSNAGTPAWSVLGSLPSGAGILGVPNGGTGLATITSNGLIYGNGTGIVNVLAPSATANYILQTTTVGGAPSWVNPATALTGTFILNQSASSQTANFYIAGPASIGAANVSSQMLTVATPSANANYIGVLGQNTAATGASTGIGVEGITAQSGGYGVYGTNTSTTAGGIGVYGTKTGATSTGAGYGVYGNATGTAANNYGGYFTASGATNNFGIEATPSALIGIPGSVTGSLILSNVTGAGTAIIQSAASTTTYTMTVPPAVATAANYVLASTGANATLQWLSPSTLNATQWLITGNSNITDGVNFLGTTNTAPINFQINGGKAGRIDEIYFNTYLGYQSGNSTAATSTGNYNSGYGNAALYTNTTGTYNTALGASALNLNSSSSYNTAVGYAALRANTGTGNTGIGYEPLYDGTSGTYNYAAGYLPMGSGVNTGSYNNAEGYEALYANTSGAGNNAYGYEALLNNSSGSYNSAMGYLAMGSGSNSGNYNNAIGYSALYSNTTGTNNNAFGYFANYYNSYGTYNNAIGYEALYDNYGQGNGNNDIGFYAGSYTGGSYNNAIGYEAGFYSENTGYSNAIGYLAGFEQFGGGYNNSMGYFAMYSPSGGYGEYNNAIGYSALYGNTYGFYNNAFGYQAMYSNTTGYDNNGIGHNALYSNTTGSSNVAVGDSAGYSNITGSYNTAVGFQAGATQTTLTNTTALGNGANPTASNQVVLGNTSVTANEFTGALMPYYSSVYNAGSAGQVLTSQGAGLSPQWVTAGGTANNGLTVTGGTTQLGGALVQNTVVNASSSNYSLASDLGTGSTAGNGTFAVTNGGAGNTYLMVKNAGTTGNPGQVGLGTSTPNSAASLDITSTTGGVLFPRLNSTQITALTPTAGLVLFNTSTNCLQLYAGGWVNIACGCTPLGAPASISGTTQYCAAASGQTYTCASVSGASSYVWSVSPTTATISGTTTTASATFPATSQTYTISVSDLNGTGCQSSFTTYTVNVGVTPASFAGNPVGPTSPNTSTVQTYTIAAVANALNYTWSSTNTNIATVSGGQGTTSVSITFSGTAGTANICVQGSNNGCTNTQVCLSVTSSLCAHSSQSFSFSNSVQTWTIPTCITTLTITANGAGGGVYGNCGCSAGLGATIVGIVNVTGGDVLNIVTGGQGGNNSVNDGSGGGGGTFIWDNNTGSLLVVAGGGGGAGYSGSGANGANAGTTTTPTSISSGPCCATGESGGAWSSASDAGAGGAGYLGNGASNTSTYACVGGNDQSNGFGGGAGYDLTAVGGYGGGGGGSYDGGGGGGGYNGGGGSAGGDVGGGGGSSYVNGTVSGTPTTTISGNGSVTINY